MKVEERHISVPKKSPLCKQPVQTVGNPWRLYCLACGDTWMFTGDTPFYGKFEKEKELILSCPNCAVPHAIERWEKQYRLAQCVT